MISFFASIGRYGAPRGYIHTCSDSPDPLTLIPQSLSSVPIDFVEVDTYMKQMPNMGLEPGFIDSSASAPTIGLTLHWCVR